MEQIAAMLTETGIPFAYDHFAEGESPEPPFLCYLLPKSDNFAADGRVYFKVDVLHIELYTDEKSPETERIVEDVLDAHGIFYNKSDVWIDSEKLYEVLYSFCLSIQSEAPVGLHGVEMEGLNDAEKEE